MIVNITSSYIPKLFYCQFKKNLNIFNAIEFFKIKFKLYYLLTVRKGFGNHIVCWYSRHFVDSLSTGLRHLAVLVCKSSRAIPATGQFLFSSHSHGKQTLSRGCCPFEEKNRWPNLPSLASISGTKHELTLLNTLSPHDRSAQFYAMPMNRPSHAILYTELFNLVLRYRKYFYVYYADSKRLVLENFSHSESLERFNCIRN